MQDQFFKDVIEGLTSSPKRLSSKYFYDDMGSDIFREIMEMESYYLTNSEEEIFKTRSKEIVESLNFNTSFRIIELGAGDGAKTSYLLAKLLEQGKDFTYSPIDISAHANEILANDLKKKHPNLKIDPQDGDYFNILKNFKNHPEPLLIMFIGSNIGNYLQKEASYLLSLIEKTMKSQDKLLIGVDLKKNPLIIREAYFDSAGITKRFNLNLLNRMNRELNTDFDLNKFEFYVSYDPLNGEVRSYLVSLEKQEMIFRYKEEEYCIKFNEGETVWTELSKKYGFVELEALLSHSNLDIIHHFTDAKNYFTDSLFVKP